LCSLFGSTAVLFLLVYSLYSRRVFGFVPCLTKYIYIYAFHHYFLLIFLRLVCTPPFIVYFHLTIHGPTSVYWVLADRRRRGGGAS
jgi:hypothetical protein